MFARIRQYATDPSKTERLLATLPAITDAIAALPGFRAYYIVRAADGTLASVSLFETEDQAEASNVVAAKWAAEHMDELFAGPPSMMSGTVMMQRTA